MNSTSLLFINIKKIVLISLVFLFPLFFLPLTQDFFITAKFYFLGAGALILILISTIELLATKKIALQQYSLDSLVFLFLTAVGLSILLSSPNKIQALLNPNFGAVSVFSLIILYFYFARLDQSTKQMVVDKVLNISALILSITAIIFFFQPLKNINLPQNWQFIKNPAFTPLGGQLELVIFLGFFVVHKLKTAIQNIRKPNNIVFDLSILVVNTTALALTIFSILKSNPILAPASLSWYAAVETLKNPLTAIFGVGIDNFVPIYTKVKDLAYNQSNLWQIGVFPSSRSALLHVFTEAGFFGLLTLGLILYAVVKNNLVGRQLIFAQESLLPESIYLIVILVFFPISLVSFFLLFILLAVASQQTSERQPIDLANFLPIYLGIPIVTFLLLGAGGYLLGRTYLAEYYFKKSIDGLVNNNVKELYDNQRQAILINPYIERFRLNFAQTNLLLANNIASKKSEEITDQDRQTIAQAIQAAIAEAKAVVALNPQKASNWSNLAEIYRNIINVAQGADTWTISAYQRAIMLDPQNPIYRLNMGGVYYSLGVYEEAIRFFEQAVGLKPDWANAHYNLAWAAYNKQDYKRAVVEMQNTLSLLDQTKDAADYKKAQTDLEEFKKKLPQEEKEATGEAQSPSQLNLPTQPKTNINPKINLPKEASPEAK